MNTMVTNDVILATLLVLLLQGGNITQNFETLLLFFLIYGLLSKQGNNCACRSNT